MSARTASNKPLSTLCEHVDLRCAGGYATLLVPSNDATSVGSVLLDVVLGIPLMDGLLNADICQRLVHSQLLTEGGASKYAVATKQRAPAVSCAIALRADSWRLTSARP
jgi:hypothetical protein